MQKTRILVVGDVMLDRFVWGKVSRISPEAPVPVVHVTHDSSYPGGAANVARNLADFGISSDIAGVIGQDAGGNELCGILKSCKIKASLLQKERRFPTIVKTRVVARQQQVVRVDREQKLRLTPKKEQAFLASMEKSLKHFDAVILEDYGKGLLTQSLVDNVITLTRKHKKILTVDPNPHNPLHWEGATLVKPNRLEAYAAAGLPLEEDQKSLLKVGKILLKKWDIQKLLITLGEQGMMFFDKNGSTYHTPTKAREVYDVSGAGDTAIAFFTAALATGLKLEEAAEISNYAAGVVVAKLGTATLTPAELINHISQDGSIANKEKAKARS